MGNDDITIEILKSIRDELKGVRVELGEVRDETRAVRTELGGKLDRTNERLDRVVHEQIRHATAIVDLEAGQRAIVDELVKLNARFDNIVGTASAVGRDTAARVDRLEERMSAVERR